MNNLDTNHNSQTHSVPSFYHIFENNAHNLSLCIWWNLVSLIIKSLDTSSNTHQLSCNEIEGTNRLHIILLRHRTKIGSFHNQHSCHPRWPFASMYKDLNIPFCPHWVLCICHIYSNCQTYLLAHHLDTMGRYIRADLRKAFHKSRIKW